MYEHSGHDGCFAFAPLNVKHSVKHRPNKGEHNKSDTCYKTLYFEAFSCRCCSDLLRAQFEFDALRIASLLLPAIRSRYGIGFCSVRGFA